MDDHPVFRVGIRELINEERDLVVCAEAGGVKDAVNAFSCEQIDVAVVDMLLEDGTGIQLAETVRSLRPTLPLLVLSLRDEPGYVKAAFQAGARGYVTKRSAAEEVLDAIREVLKGRVYFSADLIAGLTPETVKRVRAGDVSDAAWNV